MDVSSSATFGDLLRRYRQVAGLTSEDLAERARLSLRAISDLERGPRTRPWRDTVQFLADALQLGTPERAQFEAAARRQSAPSPDPPGPAAAPERSVPRNNLPVSLTPLIGREREITGVAALLQRPDVRLVSLNGPGGIGKTRLAVEVATALMADFGDGIVFVSLESISDVSLVGTTVARALEVREIPGRGIWESLNEPVRERRLLLVLDNFEQVLDAAADLVRFLGACPEVKMLVTSRSPLHVPGEREFLVPPLDVPKPRSELSVEEVQRSPAVQLFLDRAQAVRANFVLTSGNAAAVVAICRRLDGIPLAIELAAALAKALPVETLAARLTDCLRLPTPGNRAGVPRQQTLRATIEWGYDLLTDPERILFRRLAVFSGGFTL